MQECRACLHGQQCSAFPRHNLNTCDAAAQVTYYEFKKEEVDAAMEGQQKGRSLTHVPSSVENHDAFNILMARPHRSPEGSWPPICVLSNLLNLLECKDQYSC
jgi:hypothetical protein